MLERLRPLFNPTRTVVHDPYRWKHDDRTTSEKVRSGFRLVGGLVAGFLVLGLCVAAVMRWPHDPAGQYGPIVSWIALLLVALGLFCTVHRWVQLVPGFFLVPGGIGFIAAIISPMSGSRMMTKVQALEALVVTVAVIALLWRFLGRQPAPTTLLDRVALTFCVVAALKEATRMQHNPPTALILGIAALCIAWVVYQWTKATAKSDRRSIRDTRSTA